MQRTAFHQENYMYGHVLQEVQNIQKLVSVAIESIPTNNTDQE